VARRYEEIPDFGYCPNCKKADKLRKGEMYDGSVHMNCQHCECFWDDHSVRDNDGPTFGETSHIGYCGIDEDGKPWFERGI
jgi:hypothetical protein